MRKNLSFILIAFFLFASVYTYAQVTTYPYIEDFESPSVHQQTPQSCDLGTSGATFTGWTQDPNDDGDWRADTAGTPSTGTGPGSKRAISGVGVGTDANPGTTGGTYIYTEGTFPSGANPCAGSNINLISPYFDFSASSKYYQLKFNYHMLGATMGNLFIDVRSGTGSWTAGAWSQIGEKDSAWILDSVNLANFNSDSVQIRIRAVMGSSWSTDIAFDNFVVDTFSPTLAEAILLETSIVDLEYPLIPLVQFDSLQFSAKVKNEGLNEITSTKVTITTAGYSGVIDLDTITPFAIDSGITSVKYGTTVTGFKLFAFNTTVNETELDITNNVDTLSITVTDTVMGREDLVSTTLGIGSNNGVLELGQRFELNNADTITSITFYITTPPAGDSVKAHLYSYANGPGSRIVSTRAIALSASQNWYTLPLDCIADVSAGEYFATIEQMTSMSNMSLGYTTDYFTDSSSYFGSPAGWTLLESVGFFTTQLIRLNFGHYDTYREVNASTSKDTICPGELLNLQADQGETFSWSPAAGAFSPLAQTTLASYNTTTTVKVIADFGCGLTATDSLIIFVKKSPTATVTPDTSICAGNPITLEAAGGTSYRWINGPTNSDWTVTPTATSIYNVLVDSSNGCSKSFNTEVTLNEATITVSADTTACSGLPITISADDANTYAWLNGPNTASYTFDVTTTGYKYVTGTNSFGCIASDSVLVTAVESPQLTPMNDTGACFTKFITIKPEGTADTYLWSDGSVADSVKFQMLVAKTLSLIASNANGCKSYDTVLVSRFLNPTGSIDADTTICEGTELTMKAYGGDTYEWSNGLLTQENAVSPLTETKYDVVIRSAEGCEDFEDITVSVDPLPIAAFSYRDFKDSVVFTNKSQLATSYLWSFGDGATSTDEDTYHIYTDSADYTIVLTATNDCGDVDSSITINVKVPKKVNGITDLALWKNMTLYPNPSSGLLHYTIDNPLVGVMHVSIIDIAGKALCTTSSIKGSNEIKGTLDIATLTNGIYFVEFRVNNSVVRTKVIKN
ncbi:MAG: PKD repeat protein [Bacteroidia bacterium]|jgi:PKD repeat protein